MKRLIVFLSVFYFVGSAVSAQTIPYGISVDSLQTSDGFTYPIYYYKPLTYDSLTSPILWGIHGTGGNGLAEITDLRNIADRRNALIVAPTDLVAGWGYTRIDTIQNDTIVFWGPDIFKEVYRHVIAREQRDSMWVHMIGFSAGGQGVTRYMLLRQVFPDSIPIRMAVSTNPMFYAFGADFLNGECMPWPCGLGVPALSNNSLPLAVVDAYFICNDHIVQYYNENYAVLIGTADNGVSGIGTSTWGCYCLTAQGNGRYLRALNFYNFSLNDAPSRNTTLQWQYAEVPGVAHDQDLMYNTKANVTDSSTIAETLLFDSPYNVVPSLVPIADFYADVTILNINGTVNFTNTSINATSYLWNFGDGTTSTLVNPSHTYSYADTFTVSLTVTGGVNVCQNMNKKRHYIVVINPLSINQINADNFQAILSPNPASDKVTITSNFPELTLQLVLFDIIAKEQKQISFKNSVILDVKDLNKGIYIFKLFENKKMLSVGKIIKE